MGAVAVAAGCATGGLPRRAERPAPPCAPWAGDDPLLVRALGASLRLNGGAARWDAAAGAPRVWVQPRPAGAAGARWLGADFARAVEGARLAWRGAVPGLALARTDDSASATVRVVWRATLPREHPADGRAAPHPREATSTATSTATREATDAAPAAPVAGRASVWLDDAGRPVAALIELAAAAGARRPYAPEDVRVVALHEFGHVLGLAHDPDVRSVMAPTPRAESPSRRDRAVLRRLYALPPGRAALRCLTGAPRGAP